MTHWLTVPFLGSHLRRDTIGRVCNKHSFSWELKRSIVFEDELPESQSLGIACQQHCPVLRWSFCTPCKRGPLGRMSPVWKLSPFLGWLYLEKATNRQLSEVLRAASSLVGGEECLQTWRHKFSISQSQPRVCGDWGCNASLSCSRVWAPKRLLLPPGYSGSSVHCFSSTVSCFRKGHRCSCSERQVPQVSLFLPETWGLREEHTCEVGVVCIHSALCTFQQQQTRWWEFRQFMSTPRLWAW